ncbi:MAG: glycosyltransferase [Clostridium sp.]
MKKKLSVIMSVYNEKKEWLEMSIQSILTQTFQEFEFIIVLDNPNNMEAKNILKKYMLSDKRIKIIYNEKNEGLVYSLNKALEFSNGEFIARMDADDISKKDRFEIQLKYLEQHSNIDIVAGFLIKIDEIGKVVSQDMINDYSYNDVRIRQTYENYIPHPTWMFRKSILKKLKGYNLVPLAEDYDFTCRALLNNYNIKVIPEYLIYYRIRNNGISIKNNFKQFLIANEISKSYMSAIIKNKEYNPYKNIEKIINSNYTKLYKKFKYKSINLKKIILKKITKLKLIS